MNQPVFTLNPEIFREYDLRGLAETDLHPAAVLHFGERVGAYFLANGLEQVLVGRDNRLSSPAIRDSLVDGLLKSGVRLVDIGEVTTPLFYYARILYNIEAGVMITASHNPPQYNGFKVARGPATIYGEEIQQLRRWCDGEKVPGWWEAWSQLAFAGTEASGLERQVAYLEQRNPLEDYFKMLIEKIHLGVRRLKVVVDCGNGAASRVAPEFLRRLGCEVVPLYCEPDGRFPNHQPDPVEAANLRDLRKKVLAEKADLGVGYDGDGDRLGVVDDQGNILWGDQLMILFWREILPKHPGALAIIEVKSSQALVDEVKRLGGRPIFYRTGHSLIKAKMRETGAIFTGEMSGHMFFADEYYGFDDALYATGRLLRILSNTDQPLSVLFADVPRYYATAETRVPCSDQDKFRVVEELARRFKESHQVVDVDGARVLFPDGWGLVRASNTQPVIVARCEGRTLQALQEICGVMKEALDSFPEVKEFKWEGMA